MATSEESVHFSAAFFFESQPPPSDLEAVLADVEHFITRHAALGRRIVLVTVRLGALPSV